MNPYGLLSKLYGVNSLNATLTRPDGRVYLLHVEPMDDSPEQFLNEYQGAVEVRSWSVSLNELKDESGIPYYPGEGDVLRVTSTDGNLCAYKLARNAMSSRFWSWRWDRPGGRIVFYTSRKELQQ